jgi:signal transduction histidine kinase
MSAQFIDRIDDLREGEGFSGRVVQSGKPLVVPDLRADPRLTRSVVSESGFCSLAVTPLVSRGRVLGTLFVLSRDEASFLPEDVELLTALGGQIGLAVENARFLEAEQHRAEQFRVIAEVGRRISLTLDMDQALGQLTRLVQQAFGYYHVGIGLVDGDEVVYRIGAGSLWDDPEFKFRPARLKVGEQGFAGWVAASGETLLAPDVSKDPRYVLMQGSQARSELTVPIIVKSRVIGVLDVQSDRLNAFDDTDVTVLQSVAHQAGAAIENARLREQAQQAAVMEERQRLARELHDAVTQTLFSASLIAEAVPTSYQSDPEEGQRLLTELQQLTRGALAEMRTLLLELRPAVVAEASLQDLLRQLAEAATGRMGALVSVAVEGDCALPRDVHIALYRIAQEALNNVVKHARASQAEVRMRCLPTPGAGSIELQVRDNGRGFQPKEVTPEHLGLSIMRERAAATGARLTIESMSGLGTSVTVVWPADSEAPLGHLA